MALRYLLLSPTLPAYLGKVSLVSRCVFLFPRRMLWSSGGHTCWIQAFVIVLTL